MSLDLLSIEDDLESDFISKWNHEVEKILDHGAIWIEKSIIWKQFCHQIKISIKKPSTFSHVEHEKLSGLTDYELNDQLLKSYRNLILETI